MSRFGFFPEPGKDYSRGDEPAIAYRLQQLARHEHLHLIGTSGYRTPAHSVAVGGFANDPHTRGQASDTPGIEHVSEATLNRFGLTRPMPNNPKEADHIQLLRAGSGTGPKREKTDGGVFGIELPGLSGANDPNAVSLNPSTAAHETAKFIVDDLLGGVNWKYVGVTVALVIGGFLMTGKGLLDVAGLHRGASIDG